MLLSGGDLIVVALGLFLVFGYFSESDNPGNGAAKPVRSAVSVGISQTAGLACIAALLAALITWLLPSWSIGDTGDLTLRQLDQQIAQINLWLGRAWMLTALICITLLFLAFHFGKQVKKTTAERIGTASKGIGWLKFVCTILAASSFVGTSINGEQIQRQDILKQSRKDLANSALLLFSKAENVMLTEALQEASQGNPQIGAIAAAYETASPYLPPVPESETSPPGIDPFSPLADLMPPPAVEVPQTAATDAELAIMRDLTAKQIETLGNQIGAEQGGSKALAAQLTKIALDKSATEAIKSHLLSVGNPVLDRLVSNIADPVIFDPLKKKLGDLVGKWVAGKIDSRAALLAAREEVGGSASKLFDIAPATTSTGTAGDSFGIAEWDEVRLEMASAIERGLNGKPPAVQDEARAMSREFMKTRAAMLVLTSNSPNRSDFQEATFRRYLFRNPDYAAIWGYGAIAFAPDRLADDMKQISVKRIAEDRVPELRQYAQQSPDGEQIVNDRFGFGPNSLSRMSDYEVAQSIYDSHGPYPVDGFELYFKSTSPADSMQAVSFYRKERTGNFVGKYCPG